VVAVTGPSKTEGRASMVKTYSGSCHCGAVRYEADIDLGKGTHKCNCTYCTKVRLWGVIIKPNAFRLLSGEDVLRDYYKEGGATHHLYCSKCAVRSFERGYLEVLGGEYITINLGCLDNMEPAELLGAPVRYMDGRNNDWFSAPAETRHL
jgi:hypothetical protein